MKKKVLFITNIPAPYRIDFYNELGKCVDLTVLFEAKGASDQGIRFNYNYDKIENFRAIFLSNDDIKERRIDWSIFKYLKYGKYDVIVTTNYSYFTEMAALIYLKLRRIPYYMETDGGIIREENVLKKSFKRFLVSGAKGYFSPSKSSDDYLVYYGARKDRIHRYPFTSLKKEDILSCPLAAHEKTEYRNQLSINEEFMVLGVGQFIYRKGWDILLQAAAKLDKDIGVYIVGGEPTDEYLKQQKELELVNVHFSSFKTKEELKKYFMAADVFILPTREDIWGLVINEARAYGLPVITTDKCVAGLELVEDNMNGFLLSAEEADEIAEKINSLSANRTLCPQMGSASLKKISACTIEEMSVIHNNVLCY